jgi:hypothetical protein
MGIPWRGRWVAGAERMPESAVYPHAAWLSAVGVALCRRGVPCTRGGHTGRLEGHTLGGGRVELARFTDPPAPEPDPATE